jgi:hypothetical protein
MTLSSRVYCVSLLAVALPAFAVAQQSSSTPQQSDKPSKPRVQDAAKHPKPKKVWTNDDLSSVKGGISVVGEPGNASTPKSNSDSGSTVTNRSLLESLRAQHARLQAQLDAADKKIEELRNFKGENSAPSGGINPRHGYSMTPISDQIKQLEEKKSQIQAQLDELEDRARKNGIEPGQLR